MAEDTLDLLKSSQLSVKKLNPRQYAAKMPAMGSKLEVWFQRASDVVLGLLRAPIAAMQFVDQRAMQVAPGRMHCHASGLINRDHPLVFEQDRQLEGLIPTRLRHRVLRYMDLDGVANTDLAASRDHSPL